MIPEVDVVHKSNADSSAPSRSMDKLSVADVDAHMKAGFLFGAAEKYKIAREQGCLGNRPAFSKLSRCSSRDYNAGRVMGVGDQSTAVKS